jgi:predicted alpha-1,2-mannosidase
MEGAILKAIAYFGRINPVKSQYILLAMRRYPFFFGFFFCIFCAAGYTQSGVLPADLVNPLMGTQSTYTLSAGNTYPSVSLPWGMNSWSPQTGKMGDGWMYSYTANKIRGIRQTHQPSPWINDYGCFSLMPVSGRNRWQEDERASWFSHKGETARPYYYSVYLADYHATAELVPTERAAMLRTTFGIADSAAMIIDCFDKGSYIKVMPNERKVIGYSTKNSGGVPNGFKNYFVVEFSHAFRYRHTWNGARLAVDSLELQGNHVGAIIGFNVKPGEQVTARIASSFISFNQAQLNLNREIGSRSFESLKKRGLDIWNKTLGRIAIEDNNIDNLRTLYSCLYRALLFPRAFYELDSQHKIVHYSPYNGQVLPGYMFTDNGFWDTFRAVFPFFTLLFPTLDAQIMEGLANAYKESGWLPEWASPGHRDCMIGSNSASLIADAYVKGIRGYDAEKLYEAVVKNANNEGPLNSVGRKGAQYYNRLGYVPNDVGINESAARSLEYAYADYCIAQLAKALNKPDSVVAYWTNRSRNYRFLFDSRYKLMSGKRLDGQFPAEFNPFMWGGDFTEGNAWHYTWSVFQDVEGLKQLMGGDKTFVNMLDSVFKMPPVYDESYYGQVIHEIREMQIMNMGQYAHGNQPIQHLTYLYKYTNEPWKTDWWVREVMIRLYSASPDGYCGDEDNGQTSTWYVFSSLGFYPVCPGSKEYVLGIPLFKKATVTLENGKKLVIYSRNLSPANRYVQQVLVNGKPYTRRYFTHEMLLQGAAIEFVLGPQAPAQAVGKTADYPFSLTPAK